MKQSNERNWLKTYLLYAEGVKGGSIIYAKERKSVEREILDRHFSGIRIFSLGVLNSTELSDNSCGATEAGQQLRGAMVRTCNTLEMGFTTANLGFSIFLVGNVAEATWYSRLSRTRYICCWGSPYLG